jgi:hypothetical protein
MGQITIYLNNELESKVKEISKSLGTSISKYVASLLEKNIHSNWDPKTKELPGSWDDFPTIEEIRKNSTADVEREAF